MTLPGESMTLGRAPFAPELVADTQICADFCFRGEEHGKLHYPPSQVIEVSRRVLSAFVSGRTEAVVAPALGDVGAAALVVKSVASVLGPTPRPRPPGRPPRAPARSGRTHARPDRQGAPITP